MVSVRIGVVGACLLLSLSTFPALASKDSLPVEPDPGLRIDEIYDHEARLFIMLYSLKGDGTVDYITGRSVMEHARSAYGNPVYYTEPHPLFYWWNHTMWNDPQMDGVNGNERVYQENIDFDLSRYKPCSFNGQAC
ncbi:MAG: hypothetical protein ACKOBZ_02625 [Nitrospira sp.]|nr:hypothetical protein [Nitrospira sp.]